MTEKSLSVDDKVHELKLGASFNPKSRVAFHSIRYDFQPASVDTTKEGIVEVGEGHHVTLTVPHVEGSEKTHTVYKGNKRPVSKECVLIIDHDTGTFTLERLSNNINVKKTRQGRPVTPVELTKPKPVAGKEKTSYGASNNLLSPAISVKPEPPIAAPKLENAGQSPIGEVSDSSSGSDSDSGSSDSDSDDEKVQQDATVPTAIQKPPVIHKPQPVQMSQSVPKPQQQPPLGANQKYMNFIKEDLCLSDTSDSDCD